MYVCLCNGVTDHDIRFAVESGCTSLRCISAKLGVATGCGRCKQEACRVIREHKLDMSGTVSVVGAD